MATYANLPGVQVTTLDGGLATSSVPSARSTMIIGTSGIGPANEPYNVTDRALAAQIFGLSGSLVRAMEEVASGGSDNIIMFRMGTTQALLNNVGKDTTVGTVTPGFSISFQEVATTAGTDYKIWYAAGVLYVWLNGQLIFSNDVANDTALDLAGISITGTVAGNIGLPLGTGMTGAIGGAITLTAAAALSGTSFKVAPTFVPAVVGTSLTGRQTYIAISEALEILEMYPIDQIYCPDALIDNPNVAYYVSSDTTTVANNPATNPNALDWLKITVVQGGGNIYQWASETMDSTGATVTAMTATDAPTRIAAGFFETNYACLLGNFCRSQEAVGISGNCVGFLGTSAPATFSLLDTRKWIGFLPTYDVIILNKAVSSGKGLLGLPILTGCSSNSLNTKTTDYAKGYRVGGIYLTDNGLYDGVIQTDNNGNPIDVGAYLHVVADYAVSSNGYSTNYVTNLAGIVGGFHSTLDQKVALTNKPVNVIQLWKANNAQMDSLTLAGVNVLRFKGPTVLPCLLHGETIANQNSDYINLLRQMIKGLVVSTVRQVADGFIGYASTDLLQLSALETALSNKFTTLQKRGYLSGYAFNVLTSKASVRLGHAAIAVSFVPASELVQLQVTVGATLS